jgi:hypothetical protein
VGGEAYTLKTLVRNMGAKWQELAEYSSADMALQDDPYTPSTHTFVGKPL